MFVLIVENYDAEPVETHQEFLSESDLVTTVSLAKWLTKYLYNIYFYTDETNPPIQVSDDGSEITNVSLNVLDDFKKLLATKTEVTLFGDYGNEYYFKVA